LLDDPFSALDKTTRNLISVRLFGSGGLLRRLGTTVIYTTHDGMYSTKSLYLDRPLTVVLEQFKSSADRVFRVDMEGSLTELPHQRSNLLDLMEIPSVPEVLPESKEKALETITVKKTSNSETDRTKLLIQDRTVYKTYFKSVGSLHTGLFLAGGVLFSFTLKFPGSY
jgi:ATP-binding cassette subfamily C (CFTR/MRP) protein 1